LTCLFVGRLIFMHNIQIWKIAFLVLVPSLREDGWWFWRAKVFIGKVELQVLFQLNYIFWFWTHTTSIHEVFVAIDTSLIGLCLNSSRRLTTHPNSRLTLMIQLYILNTDLSLSLSLIRSELVIWIYVCVGIFSGKDGSAAI